MFVVGIALTSLGYALVYYGWSMAKGYNRRNESGTFEEQRQGGIPLPQLLGIPTKYGINQPHSTPPFNADVGRPQPATTEPKKKGKSDKGKVQAI